MDENSNFHVDRIEKSPQVTPLSLITLSFATVSPPVCPAEFLHADHYIQPDQEIDGMNIGN